MPTKYTIQDEKPSRKKIIITEIDADVISRSEKKVLQKLSQELNLKGFRPGKIPERVVRETVHESFITEKSIEESIPFVLQDVLQKNPFRCIGHPQLQIEKFFPLRIEVLWDFYPEVIVGDYKKISIPKKLPKGIKIEEEYFKQLILLTQVDIPLTLLREEKRLMLTEIKEQILRQGMSFEQYLSSLKKTEEQLFESFEPQAHERITLRMALEAIANQEKIDVSDADIEHHLQKLLKTLPESKHAMVRSLYKKGSSPYNMLKYRIVMQKTLEKIIPKV